MNKTEFINKIAADTNLKKKEIEAMLESFMKNITDILADGEKIQFIGFGTFETAERAERTCRNPKDGTLMTIPATRVARFKVGKMLKDAVAKKKN